MRLENRTVSHRRGWLVGIALAGIGFTGCDQHPENLTANGSSTASTLQIEDVGAKHSLASEPDARQQSKGPARIEIEFPLQVPQLEALNGKLVSVRNSMVVVDTYNLAKSGQMTLAAGDRLYTPTNSIDPNDTEPDDTRTSGKENAKQIRSVRDEQRTMLITLDDGSAEMDPRPVPFLPSSGGRPQPLRIGSRINDLTGLIKKSNGRYYLVPDRDVSISPANRPRRPDLGDANFTVASCNVLNFFTTIDDGENRARGADSEQEFQRQQQKLVAGLLAIDADVYGLIELENGTESDQILVTALNKQLGTNCFSVVGVPDGFAIAPGGDNAIRVGIIYRRDRVLPIGDVGMISDEAFANARTPLLQQFRRIDGSERITVIVNHFKSKGSRQAAGADVDQNDGQGGFNASRRAPSGGNGSARKRRMTFDDQANLLVVGDLNAYCEEDPIDTLRAGGMIDLIGRHTETQQPYSYVYYGQSGLLDHAFSNLNLADKVTMATVWHVNCDEPRCFDYNVEFNPPEAFYPDPYRYSDHDPILVGLNLD